VILSYIITPLGGINWSIDLFASHWGSNLFINDTDLFKNADSFRNKTSGFMRESLNHSLNWFVQKCWFIQEWKKKLKKIKLFWLNLFVNLKDTF